MLSVNGSMSLFFTCSPNTHSISSFISSGIDVESFSSSGIDCFSRLSNFILMVRLVSSSVMVYQHLQFCIFMLQRKLSEGRLLHATECQGLPLRFATKPSALNVLSTSSGNV